MERSALQAIEFSIQHTHRRQLWTPFLQAVRQYQLIAPGDRIAVCISGGKDSMLMGKMMQLLQQRSDFPFSCVYLVMDPGYRPADRRRITDNAARLGLPVTVFSNDIFAITAQAGGSPCYLCARMRRGALYEHARQLGCNKIALGHHLDDVVETLLLSECYGGQLKTMIPKLHSTHFPGMELIRPLYCVREKDIIAWARENQLEFLQCACRFTEQAEGRPDPGELSKRRRIKQRLAEWEKEDPDIVKSLFAAVHHVEIETFPGYKARGGEHSFLEDYPERGQQDEDPGD